MGKKFLFQTLFALLLFFSGCSPISPPTPTEQILKPSLVLPTATGADRLEQRKTVSPSPTKSFINKTTDRWSFESPSRAWIVQVFHQHPIEGRGEQSVTMRVEGQNGSPAWNLYEKQWANVGIGEGLTFPVVVFCNRPS